MNDTNKKQVHIKTFPMPWGDMDALGHMNNCRYFDHYQQARIDWFETLDYDLKKHEGPILLHIASTFLKPVIYPAMLTIKTSLHSLGRSSFMLDHQLWQGDDLMADATSKIVWVDYLQNKSKTIPDKIRALIL